MDTRTFLITIATTLSACTFDTTIDVGWPAGSDDTGGSTGLGHTSVADITGVGESGSGHGSSGLDGSTGATGESTTSGYGESTTGDPPSMCPGGIAAMVDDRCVCAMDDGSARVVDPEACGCEVIDQVCECQDGVHDALACAWPCQDTLDGQGCLCEGYQAPYEWCSYACDVDPVLINGSCVCPSTMTAMESWYCECAIDITTGLCGCGGAIMPPWFCGV